jgi:transketolase
LADPRDALIEELLAIAPEEERLVVLDADVSRTSRTRRFRDAFPDRFYDLGVAEQNLFGVAAGLAAAGRIPVAVTFAIFASLRAAEPIRTSICYPRLNVKIIGGYAGLSNGKDGATHQSLEDMAIMRSFAHLTVLAPSDAVLTRKMLRAAVAHPGPVYLRLEYGESPLLYPESVAFTLGRGQMFRQGAHVTVVSYGTALARVQAAADLLAAEGIEVEVIDMPSLKPLDTALLCASAKKTGAVLTVEEHSIIGGLGSAVSECLLEADLHPRFHRLGVRDRFTESGTPEALRDKYDVGEQAIARALRALVAGREK